MTAMVFIHYPLTKKDVNWKNIEIKDLVSDDEIRMLLGHKQGNTHVKIKKTGEVWRTSGGNKWTYLGTVEELAQELVDISYQNEVEKRGDYGF